MEPPMGSSINDGRPPARAANQDGKGEDMTRLVGAARGRQESRCGKLNFKLRKWNRALRANRLGDHLLGCLDEFLASRNVINQTERYEKICDETSRRVSETDLRQASACRAGRPHDDCNHRRSNTNSNNNNRHHHHLHHHNYWQVSDRLAGSGLPLERVKKFDQCERRDWEGKHGIGRLLADLLSGRHGNRLAALSLLLRAPVVLAALFSFALAISLIILYTLSFHHCQARAAQVGLVAAIDDWLPVAGSARNRSATINSETVVLTECGPYEGRPEGGALRFRGVAYASPPVGARRWQKPRPIWLDRERCARGSSWPEQAAREHCVQLSPFNHLVSGSEDCLYLDVYTPARLGRPGTTAERLPVMVYIHGGFLVFGSNGAEQANWLGARPSGQLAAELNVVLVAPNYRLQALGFMALKQLALDNGADGSEGNYGLWDQLIALQWVRRNIDSFGGDPGRVLLFGPDAASALPLALVSRKRRDTNRDDDDDGGGQAGAARAPVAPDCAAAGLDEPPATSGRAEACRKNNSGDDYEQLFHSVWLMNPTIYYELPYELANQHYARLIKSQSVCSSDLVWESPASGPSGESGNRTTGATSSTPGGRHQASRVAAWRETRSQLQASNTDPNRLAECLLGLSGEQVVREYLGRDEATFRLDDENSLPIRNIFPDQFVTLDGQLVRDSFPFLRAAAGAGSAAGGGRPTNFLIGSTAQAVGFWPCPRNLADWSWADFRHYTATSLNSFALPDETLAQVNELYGVPSTNSTCPYATAANGTTCRPAPATGSPAETYLTMVSDIRQVCPARELARSLRLAGSVGALERYIVEWRPSSRLADSLARSSGAANASDHLHYAFHYWDLLALFGFEFDQRLEPDASDLEFQRRIRALAKRLAWSSPPETEPAQKDDKLTMFTRDGQVRSSDQNEPADSYKWRECKLWQQSLKQSYAWIS